MCPHSTMPPSRIEMVCLHCGNPYAIKRSHAATSRYCSNKCKWEYLAGRPRLDLEERFWAKVDKASDCWMWTAATSHGYGRFRVGGLNGKTLVAPRIAWELINGPIPNGLQVCHRCDSKCSPGDITYRRCVNPAHLFLGTVADNSRDMATKHRGSNGQGRHGIDNGRAKLTEAIVADIRARFAAGGITKISLAHEYLVSDTVISHIITGKRWPILTK